jgi:glycosyltransferase involved in cell wall biosynthesis
MSKIKNNILVSTITPSFRIKKYLELFLNELPKQTYFDKLEVVLDHNEPDEEEISWVKEFQTKYPGKLKHIIVNPVEPIGTSMNRCIREASGKYVTIWNVDDLRTPDSIEQQADLMEKNPGIDIVYGDFLIVRSFGAKNGKLISTKNISKTELTRSMILGPFFMFKKSLCQKAGFFDEQLKSGADFDLALRLAFNGRAAMAPGLLGYYLDEGKGASTKPDSLRPIENVVICSRYGIYDKIDKFLYPQATRYNIPYLLQQNQWVHVSNFIPNYEEFIKERYRKYYLYGKNLLNIKIRKWWINFKFFIKKIIVYK